MQSKNKAKLAAVAAAFSSGILALNYSASAQLVEWQGATPGTGNASGSWNSPANWVGGVTPVAANTADFTQQDLTVTNSTVTLDANQSIFAINFGDSNTTSSGGWIVNSSASSVNSSSDVLTLTAPGYNIITVNQLGAGSVATINADLSDGTSGGLGLAKGGAGTLVLTGNNSGLTGATAINNGILELDFSQTWSPTVNILGDDGLGDAGGSHVNFQGAELLLNGSSGKANSQTLSSGTALENGGSTIRFNQNGATSLSLGLGALTRNLYATIDVQLPTAGTVSVAAGTGGQAYPDAALGTSNTGLGGLLVDTNGSAFATVNNGADWAIVNGSGDIAPGASNGSFYTASTATTLAGNADVVTNVTLGASAAVSTMRFNGASASTINVGAGNTLTTGGILMTPTAGGSNVIQGGNLVGSQSGGGDTQVGVFSTTNSLTIGSVVSGATAITKTGAGTLVLAANNTYTGETVVNGGAVNLPTGSTIGTFYTFPNALNADVQIAPAFGDSATMNVTGGTLNAARTIIAGNDNNFAGGTGVLNQTGGTINSSQWFTVGGFGNGTFNMSGGVLNQNAATGTVMEISVFGTSNGTVNLSGTGQININNNGNIVFGSVNTSGNGTLNQEGGGITFYSDNGVTVGGSGGVVIGGAGVTGTATDTYNLDGGTLTTPSVSHAGGTGIMNFNGGTLIATGNAAAFVGGLSQGNIKAGGAIINSNGFNIGISQPLLHAASLGATVDGGLTKNGAGSLTLSGASTYTGATTINAGTVILPSASVPVPVASYSFDSIAPGVLSPGAVITNTGSGGAALNGVVNITDWSGVGSGPASGATVIASGPYASSHSVQFDGAGTSIDVPSQIVDQSGGASWTFSAWVQTNIPGATIISKNTGGDTWGPGNTVYYLASNGGGSETNVWNNNGYPTGVRFGDGFVQGTPPGALATDGNWHMVTFTDNGGTQSIYMDGVNLNLNVTGAGGTDVSTLTRLGINVDTFFAGDGNVDFAGNMDDLNFYNVGLNASQIGQLFSSNMVTGSGGGGQFLPVTSPVNITASGASLNLNSQNQIIGSLAGVAGSTVVLGGGVLTTGGNNTSTSFAGIISGTGGVIKTGTGTQTITGANSYSGGTTVSAGKLLVGANGALPDHALSVTGGTAELGVNTGQALLTSLSITGTGVFDIGNNHAIISYGAGEQASTDATIRGYLLAGRDGGAWNGTGGIDSSGSGSGVAAGYSIGYADGADGVVQVTPANPLGLSSGQIELKYTLLGDANLDGVVNGDDFTILVGNLGKTVAGWDKGDFLYTGSVTGDDFTALVSNLGKQANGADVEIPASDIQAIAAFAAANDLSFNPDTVPEPATMSILAIGTLGILGRRRRRKEEATI